MSINAENLETLTESRPSSKESSHEEGSADSNASTRPIFPINELRNSTALQELERIFTNLELLQKFYPYGDPKKNMVQLTQDFLTTAIRILNQLAVYYPQLLFKPQQSTDFEMFTLNQVKRITRFINNPTNLNDPQFANQVEQALEWLNAVA